MDKNWTGDIVGRRVEWTDEDGTKATGIISSCKIQHHAGLDMDLTHVEVDWDDGTDRTQHTIEAMLKDPRVKIGR
jgi:hypothetical protein